MHNFYEKIENLRTKIKFLKNFEDKFFLYIYIYIYSAINLVNNGKQLMIAHAWGNSLHLHELEPSRTHPASFHV